MLDGLVMVLVCAVSYGWAWVWIRTYKASAVLGYIKHTVLFTALSLAIIWLFLHIVFLTVDETYSFSNIGALGMWILLCLPIFGLFCLYAIFQTGFALLEKKREEEKKEEK